MTTRFADHLLEGIHSELPAATAVPTGTLFACSEHTKVYQSDGSTWSDWHDGSNGGGGGDGDVTLIDSNVLESAAASVVFSSIPGTFSDLQVRLVARGSNSAIQLVQLRFNGDTGSNYGWGRHFGHISTGDVGGVTNAGDYTGATEVNVASIPGTSAGSGEPVQSVIDILGYAGTTFRKLVRSVGSTRNETQLREERFSGIWADTAAVSSVTLFPSVGNFIVGSRFALYGIG